MATLIAVRRGAPVTPPWAPPAGAGRGTAPQGSTDPEATDADVTDDPVDAALTRLLDGFAAGEAARDEEVTP
jgi:hypothetical protein